MTVNLTSQRVAAVTDGWSEAITAELANRGGTITKLAEQIGVSRQYLTRVVTGDKHTCPIETYLAICRALDLDPNCYATIDESTPPWDSP